MRADRLLSILLLLQVNRRMTARELAERLEVSERTILRDMDALSGAGVPVTAERGTGGGWHLLQEYKTDLTGLNAAEVQTLFVAKSSRLLADLGLTQAADAAAIKLLASLSSASRHNITIMQERLHIDGAGWFQSHETLPLLPLLQEAVWQERQVQMAYQRADGSAVERLVDPLGLVAKGSVWYLIASVEGEMRSYRVSRVQSAQKTETPCVRPPGFDLAAFWEQSITELKANVPRYPATVRVSPDLLTRMRRASNPRIVCEAPPGEDGWVILDVMFEVESEACDFIIRSGRQIEAISPPSLRQRVREFAASIVTLHTSDAD